MLQEDKELLLKDLCSRLPYGVKVQVECDAEEFGKTVEVDEITMIDKYGEEILLYHAGEYFSIEEIKPYLRPMSSMTEEEKDELHDWGWEYTGNDIITGGSTDADNCHKGYEKNLYDLKWLGDWLNAHHFDYRGLIEKGLALEAPECMYK